MKKHKSSPKALSKTKMVGIISPLLVDLCGSYREGTTGLRDSLAPASNESDWFFFVLLYVICMVAQIERPGTYEKRPKRYQKALLVG